MGKTGLGLRLAALAALTAPAAAQETLELPTLMVTGLAAGEAGLAPERTSLGAKIDTRVEFIPQSVSIVTQDALQQRQPQTLEEAIAYVPGVVPSPWGMDNRFSQFLIRGFDVGTYGIFRDGLGQRVIGFSGFNIEPYTLERVEVLRGPNGVLYGETNPGGIVNAVTKRPTFEPLREAFLSYGSFDTVQGGFDLGGPIGDTGTLAYRLTGFYSDGETSLENSYDDRKLLAPALTWAPTEATSLTILANFQHDKTSPAMYLPIEQRTDYREFYFNGMLTDDSMSYADFSVKETSTIVALDNRVEFAFSVGQIQDTLLIGADYYRSKADSKYGYDDSYEISILDPIFDFARPTPVAVAPKPLPGRSRRC